MLTTSQARAAWGPPCNARQRAPVTLTGGAVVTVDPRTIPAVQAMNAVLARYSYAATPPDCGAYVCRQITGGTGYSLHAYGIAVDINWQANPYFSYPAPRAGHCDMPDRMPYDICAIRTVNGQQVWGWGGFYSSIRDYMHYEIVCSPADLATGIAGTPAATTEGFGTMTDAEIDAKFLVLKVELDRLSAAVEALHTQAQSQNKAARDRDAKILAALTQGA